MGQKSRVICPNAFGGALLISAAMKHEFANADHIAQSAAESRTKETDVDASPIAPASGEAPASASEAEPSHDCGASDAPSGALFVTRPAHFTKENSTQSLAEIQQSPQSLTSQLVTSGSEPRILLAGVDSLDVGFFIRWEGRLAKAAAVLEHLKRKAVGTKGLLLTGCDCLVLPGGKPPRYRWHLQYPQFHLFLSKQTLPEKGTPNAMASISSELLWREGREGAMECVFKALKELGAVYMSHKLSRVDACMDVYMPEGLTLPFLQTYRVPPNRQENVYATGDRLETFYHGAKDSPIQLRIYDKSHEIQTSEKTWFHELWSHPTGENVWRIEFQLRREPLRQCNIDSLEDLQTKLAGLWSYLTDSWFSLRLPDDGNTTRRTVHPLWEIVAEGASRFGDVQPVARKPREGTAQGEWYVRNIAGLIASWSAKQAPPIADVEGALEHLIPLLKQCYQSKPFAERVKIKAIRSGMAA